MKFDEAVSGMSQLWLVRLALLKCVFAVRPILNVGARYFVGITEPVKYQARKVYANLTFKPRQIQC